MAEPAAIDGVDDLLTRVTAREQAILQDVSTYAIFVTDLNGRVTCWSAGAVKVFGYTAAEMVGGDSSILWVEEERERGPVLERDIATEHGIAADNRFHVRKGGARFFATGAMRAIRHADGSVAEFLKVCRDESEHQTAEQYKSWLSAVIDSSDDAIISKSLDGIIRTWNVGAERVFGYTPEEAIGRPIVMLLPPDRQDEEPRILQRLRSGERVDHFQTIRVRKGGERVNISVTISPVRDASGKVIGASKIARDVTREVLAAKERERLAEEREAALAAERAARGEAERASRMKDEFLATLSHELRTPLNAIVGWVEILRNRSVTGPESADLAEGLSVIDRNVRAQTQIIEDILDMSRIISGKLRLDIQRVSLAPLVQAGVDTVQPAALAKGVRLQVVLDPAAGPVSGDSNRLHQVIWNLLTNAVKFTPRGGRVQILLERVNSHVEISVIDTGEGIAPDFLPHVFDRFRQADSSTTRRHGGLGLGLALVKQLIELHGGSVRVKSTGQEKGSTFTVSLPLIAIHHAEESYEPVREHPEASSTSEARRLACDQLTGVTILVVDDEADARLIVRRLLEECGAKVRVASSADEALKMIEAEVPMVLISDIGMPEEDGYALIRKVRALPASRGGRVNAIALTAYARSSDRIRAMEAGFQMHLSKPVDPSELVVTVSTIAKIVRDQQSYIACARDATIETRCSGTPGHRKTSPTGSTRCCDRSPSRRHSSHSTRPAGTDACGRHGR